MLKKMAHILFIDSEDEPTNRRDVIAIPIAMCINSR